jgi:sulfatase modifying factor 1
VTIDQRLSVQFFEQRVCDIASEQLGITRSEVHPSSRLIEDLNCDSLELVELMMKLEDEFRVTIPNDHANPVGKSIFIRQPFRLKDLAEIVYVQQGTGKPECRTWRGRTVNESDFRTIPFSQLSGRWQPASSGDTQSLFEPLDSDSDIRQFRRQSDGMRCVLLPSVETTIGYDGPDSHVDERPVHTVQLDSFLIDAEPVSTTAFCRFLNSIETAERHLLEWFRLGPADGRHLQMPILHSDGEWCPVTGADVLPMVLVSWYGANAYSLWANGQDWSNYRTRDGFLPSEAQWEYGAQGAFPKASAPDSQRLDRTTMIYAQHEPGLRYNSSTMPMAPVHSPLGVSSFGLHHMAGNVWQWCRDWYEDDFYQRSQAHELNPVNTRNSGVRSERGGSWVGPPELCRTSYRRGRTPIARGRCLGFRCISVVEFIPG